MAKLVNLGTQEAHDDKTCGLGPPEANFSDDIADRVIDFDIGVRIPGLYRILVSLHGKMSGPHIALHYPGLSGLMERVHLCMYFQSMTDISSALRRIDDSIVLTTEQVTEPARQHSWLGQYQGKIVEDGHEDLIESGIPPAYYKIPMETSLTS